MLKQTQEFYTKFLTDIGFRIEDDGSIRKYHRAKGNTVSFLPVKADNHPVYIPTKATLDMDGATSIIYHPLTEDALRGESYTIKITKNQITSMMRMRLVHTLLGLGDAIVTQDGKKLTAKQQKLINQNPDFDDKALTALGKLLASGKASVVNRHTLGIYLHGKGGKYEGHEVKRLAKVSSSLYDTLDKGEKDIWGVKNISFKAQRAIKTLFDTVLPGLNDDAYTHGSNSKIAPYFDSLANVFLNLSYQFDNIDKTCKGLYEDPLIPVAKYEWIEGLGQLSKLAMAVPALRGNLGNDVIGETAFTVSNAEPKIKESATPKVSAAPLGMGTPTLTTTPTPTKKVHPMFVNQQNVGLGAPTTPQTPHHHPMMGGSVSMGNTAVGTVF